MDSDRLSQEQPLEGPRGESDLTWADPNRALSLGATYLHPGLKLEELKRFSAIKNLLELTPE